MKEPQKIEKVIEAFRRYITLKEEGMIGVPTNNVGSGNIAGTKEAGDEPPVDLRRGRARHWNPFFKDLAKVMRRKK